MPTHKINVSRSYKLLCDLIQVDWPHLDLDGFQEASVYVALAQDPK